MLDITETDIMKKWDKSKGIMLSIRCLAYNQEKYIENALDGFLIQKTDFPFEIVVHDDASSDKTGDIIRKYKRLYPNIIFPVFEVENQYSKKNHILDRIVNSKIRGKYVALCEGDDYWIDPLKLQRQVDFLESHKEYSCVYHPAYYVKNGYIVNDNIMFLKECDIKPEWMIEGGGEYCATPSLCFPKKYIDEQRKFQEITDIDDYPLQLLLAISGKIRYLPYTMSCYRVGLEQSWTGKVLSDLELQKNVFKNEINFLKEFDKETVYKYRESVYYQICLLDILLLKVTGFTEKQSFYDDYKQVRNKIKKEYLIKLYKKNKFLFQFSWAFKIYNNIKIIILNKVPGKNKATLKKAPAPNINDKGCYDE